MFCNPDMWAKAYRNFPHSNQDTNNAIESYHGYIKKRYLNEKNNANHRRVDWLIHVLLTNVQLYYIHMQRLKEAGVIRPRKSLEQLNASKCRANQIPDEDCVVNPKSNKEYRVRSQNMDTRDTWYSVIYKGSDLHFCDCTWALNGNVCKHVLKVGMLLNNNVLGDNIMSNIATSSTERPRFLVDLNETIVFSPEIETELLPPFNSPHFLNCHNETNINDVDNSGPLEVDERMSVISSIHQELREMLAIVPPTLERAHALKNLVSNAHQQYNQQDNQMFLNATPSKIVKKRRHSFLSPLNKKLQSRHQLHLGKDKPQFQRVGRVRAKKKSMAEQLKLSFQKERNVEHTSDLVQHSIPHDIGMKI